MQQSFLVAYAVAAHCSIVAIPRPGQARPPDTRPFTGKVSCFSCFMFPPFCHLHLPGGEEKKTKSIKHCDGKHNEQRLRTGRVEGRTVVTVLWMRWRAAAA
uniref:Putative secreted protein n=1 Tax=Anopheles darlingi TaxID=43151 RepID=A0A2M4DA35_ANODA